MKFILHNLRMIWSRFRSNGWVLAELFLVFVVMWFLCDSLGCLKYTFYRPLGYNIDHVYRLTTIIGGATSDTTLTNADRYLRALKIWFIVSKEQRYIILLFLNPISRRCLHNPDSSVFRGSD